jgi:hypothetical protein
MPAKKELTVKDISWDPMHQKQAKLPEPAHQGAAQHGILYSPPTLLPDG